MTLPDSQRPGIVWPSLPGPNQAIIVSLLHQFAASEWWSPAQIRQQQFRQLEEVLAQARHTVPFYQDRLKDIVRLPRGSLDDAAWASLPMLTRDDINEAGKGMLNSAIPESHGPVREERTSGSISMPVSVHTTGLKRMFNTAFAIRWWQWAGWDFAAKSARIVSLPSGQALPPEGEREARWTAVFPTGAVLSLNVSSTIDEQLAWLRRERPSYLTTHPGNLMALARACQEQGRGV